jgi:hypothetical protein
MHTQATGTAHIEQPDLDAARSVDLLALIGRDTGLVRISGTQGGEWAGPCPFCGGEDRLHVNPRRPGGARWYCRQCMPRGGDTIDYLRRRDQLSFSEAVARLLDLAPADLSPGFRGRIGREQCPAGHSWQDPGWQRGACKLVLAASARLAAPEGEGGRAYLAGRGILPAVWHAWGLGFAAVWHPVRQAKLPAITLPWTRHGTIQAVQYRFIEPGLPRAERFGQRMGGERTLYGLDMRAGPKPALIIVEGELNAVSVWQALGEHADVLSCGPQGNLQRPAVLEVAARLAQPFQRVVLWADEPQLAADALAALRVGTQGRWLWSDGGLDANDHLRQGSLAEVLAPHLAG